MAPALLQKRKSIYLSIYQSSSILPSYRRMSNLSFWIPGRASLRQLARNDDRKGLLTAHASLDHFSRFREHIGWDCHTDLVGGFEIERQIKFGRLHERKLAGLIALENLIDVFGGAP
jgi:hypothetical protein